eukprot:s2_g2.t1
MAPSGGDETGFQLQFADLVPPLTTEEFLNERWGVEPFATSLSEDRVSESMSVILPFCFTPGALDIKRAFVRDCSGLLLCKYWQYGNDIEVGMYFSRPGVEPVRKIGTIIQVILTHLEGRVAYLTRLGALP